MPENTSNLRVIGVAVATPVVGVWLGRAVAPNEPASKPSTSDIAAKSGASEAAKGHAESDAQAVGQPLKDMLITDPIVTPSGDLYLSDAPGTLWLIRQNEAVMVRVVEKLSTAPAAPTTQAMESASLLYAVAEIKRAISRDDNEMVSRISEVMREQSR
jgi:hypothetical protein